MRKFIVGTKRDIIQESFEAESEAMAAMMFAETFLSPDGEELSVVEVKSTWEVRLQWDHDNPLFSVNKIGEENEDD